MAALSLSQMTARIARLDAAKVWDAGIMMVFAALLISRALLVVGSWRSFLEAPLLVLSLPSLNDTGILLTAVVTVIYLRWQKLPLLGFLDAMAPCFALVWAFLNLGSIIGGTRDGMPTRFPLAVSDGMGGKVHPVEFYTLIVALVLCGLLVRRVPQIRSAGLGCASGLMLAGAAIFVLDFLRLPSTLFVAVILDPVQWLGLAMIVVGYALFLAFPVMPQPPVVAQNGSTHAV